MKPVTLLIKPSGSDCNIDCRYCFYKRRNPDAGAGTFSKVMRGIENCNKYDVEFSALVVLNDRNVEYPANRQPYPKRHPDKTHQGNAVITSMFTGTSMAGGPLVVYFCGDCAEYAKCSEYIVCIKQNGRADVIIPYCY